MKIGASEIFKESLSKMKVYSSNNKKNKFENIQYKNDIYPKFLNYNDLNDSKYDIILNKIQKNKQYLNNLLKNFPENKENFNEKIGILNIDIKKQRKEIKNKNKQEFQNFQNLIDILITLDAQGNIQELKQISEYEYLKLRKSNYQKILFYINKYKNEILFNLGYDKKTENQKDKKKRNLSVPRSHRNIKNGNKEYNLFNLYNEIFNIDKSKYNLPDFYYSSIINGQKKIESNENYSLNNSLYLSRNEIQYYEMNKLDIFRLMINDSSIKNEEISIFLNIECKNVEEAVNKYYQNLYGTENLTLTFSYPTFNNISIVHNFCFKSNISILFDTAIQDYPIAYNVHLFTYSNKEILRDNKNKIKCIGSLKLENNSVIFVYNKN